MRRTATTATAAPTRVSSSERARPRLPAWLLAVSLALLTIALFWPATRCDFVNYDDNGELTENIHVQHGLTWESMKWAFSSSLNGGWLPIQQLSHMALYPILGLNPWGYHLINVVLHGLNAALVFALLQQMTGARWRSVWVAALFAVHPLRVEAVAWVVEGKEVLCVFFGLLALMAYARYAQAQSLKSEAGTEDAESAMQKSGTPDTQHASRFTFHVSRLRSHAGTFYFLSLFLYALGLMSKPTVVTWPFVMLLLDYWPLGRLEPSTLNSQLSTLLRLAREKIPFFVLAALESVITLMAQQREGGLVTNESLPLAARVGNALISYCRYLGKLFWPTDMAVMYPHPGYWPLGKVVLAGGVLLGLSVLVWVQRRRFPYLLVGWLWYCGTLAPMSQVLQTGSQAMADRWTYIPSLGVLIMVVWGVCELTRGWQHRALGWSLAGGAVLVFCLAVTRQQIGHWQNSETLWRHTLDVTENNYFAHYNLGVTLDAKGQSDEALRQFEETMRLRPYEADVRNSFGAALGKKGQSEEAIRQYQEAIRLKPDHALAHNNLGAALDQKGQSDEAIRQLQEAIRLKPDYAEAHNNLGAALDKKGQRDEAIRQYQAAVRLKPDYADAHNNLGAALDDQGQSDEAIRHYQVALRLKPDHAEAHNNLGIALGRKGQSDEAIRQFQEAVRLKPDYADSYNNLGIAFWQQRRTGEAIRQFQEALRRKPDYADARKNLDAALATRAQASPPPGGATNR
jgi:protein O-mannosyl-transferase